MLDVEKFAESIKNAFETNKDDHAFDGFVFIKSESDESDGKHMRITSGVSCDPATLVGGIMFIVQKAGIDVEVFAGMIMMLCKDKAIKGMLMEMVNAPEEGKCDDRKDDKECECEKKCKKAKNSALKMAILASILGGDEDEKSDEADELESLLESIFS